MSELYSKKLDKYRNPLEPAITGISAFLLFIAVLVIWGNIAPLSTAAIAQGNLQVKTQRQSIQHPYGGIIARVLVSEGDRVARDQPVIELNRTEVQAKRDIATAEVVTLLARQARLTCERDDRKPNCLLSYDRSNWPYAELEQAISNEHAVMVAQRQQYEAQIALLKSQTMQNKEKIVGLKAQSKGLSEQSRILEEELQGARKLYLKGYTPKTRILALERTAASLLTETEVKNSEITKTEQAVDETRLAISQMQSQRMSDIVDELRITQTALTKALPALVLADDALDRTIIKAPTSGSIVGLSVFTVGGVVQSGERLMDIVPDDNPIIVEGRLRLSDVTTVQSGAIADIVLTGVPRGKRPSLSGKIISISADKLTDTKSGASFFSIRVEVDPEDIQNAGIQLQPGMPAEVIISNGTRTLVGYLFEPMLDEITHAFREQ